MRTTEYARAPLACERDPELFFPLGTTGDANQRQIARAIRACNSCPRQIACAQDALDRHESTLSIQGGLLFPRPTVQPSGPLPAADTVFPPVHARPENRGRHRDATDLEQLEFLASFGMSHDRIAAELGITPDAVNRARARERAKQTAL